MDISDKFTQFQMEQSFEALKAIGKAQEEAYNKAIQEAKTQ